MTRRALILAALAAPLALAGCGKKPNMLKPPADADPSRYPRPYPNPATDPQPRADQPQP